MGKSIVIFSRPGTALPNGQFLSVSGSGSPTSTETTSQITVPMAGTFSKLGFANSTGSGTNNTQLRVNGSNGNSLCSKATGSGWAEDASNTDTISADDEVAIIGTDNGTDPTYNGHRLVWQASGDHCSIHFATRFGGVICDQTSDRFQAFTGGMQTDWQATQADSQLKVSAGGVAKFFQIKATVNASDETRTFHVQVNGSDGNGVITVGAGLTGTFIDTSNTDTLVAGDLTNAVMDPLQATDDITMVQCGIFITNSSANESSLFRGNSDDDGGHTRSASATQHYFQISGTSSDLQATTSSSRSLRPGFTGTARNLRFYLGANTYTVNATMDLKNITKGTSIPVTITAGGGAGWYENTSDSFSFDADDELVYGIVGGTSGSITERCCVFSLLDSTVANDLFAQSVM